jgi:DNA-binding response OmpR family regulator
MQSAAPLTTILVVEDSPQLVAFLHRMLSEEGYGVRDARDGDAGLSSALEHEPDLVILDVGLPRRNGFEVIRELRKNGVHVPTLMLSARGEVADRIHGLDSGADDYLTKPFEAAELVARVRALLRRASRTPDRRLYVGDLALDRVARRVHRGDRELVLTQREFALLEYFMKNVGKPLSRATIAEEVWRQPAVDGGETNIVDVYVAYLRKKLDTPNEPPMLQTVRGTGYLLRPGTPRAN